MSELAKDPVCGMQVKVDAAKWVSEHGGKRWYFCSEGCRRKFEADPGRFDGTRPLSPVGELVAIGEMSPSKAGACCGGGVAVQAAPVTAVAESAGGYTCPMHPEVVSEKMASCPKCGMALETVAPVMSK